MRSIHMLVRDVSLTDSHTGTQSVHFSSTVFAESINSFLLESFHTMDFVYLALMVTVT